MAASGAGESPPVAAPEGSSASGSIEAKFTDYLRPYTGHMRLKRCLRAAREYPDLKKVALLEAAKQAREGWDTAAYKQIIQIAVESGAELPAPYDSIDEAWVMSREEEKTKREAGLERELNTNMQGQYQENTRRAHNEYATFHTETGQFTMAFASLMRAADYCHGKVARENGIQRALALVHMPGVGSGEMRDSLEIVAQAKSEATVGERSTADALMGMVYVREGRLDKAAEVLVRVTPDMHEVGAATAPADVALAAVLCSLATMNRRQLHARVVKNDELRALCAAVPQLMGMAEAFYQCRFKECLETLRDLEPRIRMDEFVGPAHARLHQAILQRAVVTYFEPYSTVDLGRMAALFGVDAGVLEEACVHLIGNRRLAARIDAHTKTLKATVTDQRASTYQEAEAAADDTLRHIRAVLVRASCEVHGFSVEAPSGGGGRGRGTFPGGGAVGEEGESGSEDEFGDRARPPRGAGAGGGGLMDALGIAGMLG